MIVSTLEFLEDGDVTPWHSATVAPAVLFKTLYFHTIFGFLAVPSYAGNSGQLGWKAIGFPGHLHEMGGISDKVVTPLAPP